MTITLTNVFLLGRRWRWRRWKWGRKSTCQ